MNVTVATLSLNQGRFLPFALQSVFAQNYAGVEYIVVDPGSTDNSREIIGRYVSRITHRIYEPDGGPADGLNSALAIASGDIFGWVNADDALLPGAVDAVVRRFAADPQLDVVYGDGYVIDEGGSVLRKMRSTSFDARRYVFGGVTVVQQGLFIRREALIAIQGFNSDNHTCWDGEALLELALRGSRMNHIRKPLGLFRMHPGSISGSQRVAEQYQLDLDRMFLRVLRRPRRRSDVVLRYAIRAEKWLRDPASALTALQSRARRV